MLLLIIVLFLIFGCGGGYYGYQNWGPQGGIGIGGILLLLLVLFLFFGRGRF